MKVCDPVHRRALGLPRDEKGEQAVVMGLLRRAGCLVGSTSQYRRSKQMVGLPDLVVFHEGLQRGGWWETKAYKTQGYLAHDRATWVPKALAPAQWAFRQTAIRCGHLHGYGGEKECEAFLADLGLAEMRGPVCYVRSAAQAQKGDA